MKLGREVTSGTRESWLNTKKLERQRTGNTSKRSQRRKKDKINSYLQKTLKAHSIRRQEKRIVAYVVIILPGMRKMLLYIGTECSTCI